MISGLDEPARRVAVELQLVDRLTGADVAQLGRTVGRQDDQRNPGVRCLHDGGVEIGGRGSRCAGDNDRLACGLGDSEREEARGAFVKHTPALDSLLVAKRISDRCIAGSGRHHRVLDARASELVDHHAQRGKGFVRQVLVRVAVRMSDYPPLVLLHGFAQSGESWQTTIDCLPRALRVHAIDLPGHGATGLSRGEPSVELAREMVAEAVETVGGRAAVWGYSQGARVAFDFALHSSAIDCGADRRKRHAGYRERGQAGEPSQLRLRALNPHRSGDDRGVRRDVGAAARARRAVEAADRSTAIGPASAGPESPRRRADWNRSGRLPADLGPNARDHGADASALRRARRDLHRSRRTLGRTDPERDVTRLWPNALTRGPHGRNPRRPLRRRRLPGASI